MKVTVELSEDEVLVALKRVEGYEDIHPDLLAEDAIGKNWPEYRIASNDRLDCCCLDFKKAMRIGSDNIGFDTLIFIQDGSAQIGYGLPPISFCPWCGSLKSNAMQSNEKLKPLAKPVGLKR